MILLKRRFEETKERRNHAEETAQRYQERVEQQKESLLNKMASLEENYSVYDEVSALMKEKQVEI